MTKCQAALHTLQAFPFFRPTCLCREPHVDPDCNSFQNFLFDHPCIYVLKKGKFNARGPIIFLYITSKTFANTLFISFKLPSLVFTNSPSQNSWEKLVQIFFRNSRKKEDIIALISHRFIFNKSDDFVRFSSFSYIPIRNYTKSFREYIYMHMQYIQSRRIFPSSENRIYRGEQGKSIKINLVAVKKGSSWTRVNPLTSV